MAAFTYMTRIKIVAALIAPTPLNPSYAMNPPMRTNVITAPMSMIALNAMAFPIPHIAAIARTVLAAYR